MELGDEDRSYRLPLRFRVPLSVRELCLGETLTYLTSPGKLPELYCPVCGTLCREERNKPGVPGRVAAMAGVSRPHDRFICPHEDQAWHCQAYNLINEMQHTASRRLADLMRLDLEETLAERLPAEQLRSSRRLATGSQVLIDTGA